MIFVDNIAGLRLGRKQVVPPRLSLVNGLLPRTVRA